jgi:hypothetical protein
MVTARCQFFFRSAPSKNRKSCLLKQLCFWHQGCYLLGNNKRLQSWMLDLFLNPTQKLTNIKNFAVWPKPIWSISREMHLDQTGRVNAFP